MQLEIVTLVKTTAFLRFKIFISPFDSPARGFTSIRDHYHEVKFSFRINRTYIFYDLLILTVLLHQQKLHRIVFRFVELIFKEYGCVKEK